MKPYWKYYQGQKCYLTRLIVALSGLVDLEGKLIKPAGGLLSQLICHIINAWYLVETVLNFGKNPKSYSKPNIEKLKCMYVISMQAELVKVCFQFFTFGEKNNLSQLQKVILMPIFLKIKICIWTLACGVPCGTHSCYGHTWKCE